MTITQLMSLLEVALNSGELSSSELAEKLQVTKPSVTRIVDLWGDEGVAAKQGRKMIRRTDLEGDRRTKVLFITPSGERFVKSLFTL